MDAHTLCDIVVNCQIQPLDSLPIIKTTKGENNEPQSQHDVHRPACEPSAVAQQANEISICRFYYSCT